MAAVSTAVTRTEAYLSSNWEPRTKALYDSAERKFMLFWNTSSSCTQSPPLSSIAEVPIEGNSEPVICAFMTYMASTDGGSLAPATIHSYKEGVLAIFTAQGRKASWLFKGSRCEKVFTGIEKQHGDRRRPLRLPFTPAILRQLAVSLKEHDHDDVVGLAVLLAQFNGCPASGRGARAREPLWPRFALRGCYATSPRSHFFTAAGINSTIAVEPWPMVS